MIQQVTGMSGNCVICLTTINESETVYVHDEVQHPLHPVCHDRWKRRCQGIPKEFTCPTCNKVMTAAASALTMKVVVEAERSLEFGVFYQITMQIEVPATISALWKRMKKTRGPTPLGPSPSFDHLPCNIWQKVNLINAYLQEHIFSENDSWLITPLRSYFCDNIGVEDKDAEVIAVVQLFEEVREWPRWYATKLAAARGREKLSSLLSTIPNSRSLCALAFLEFVTAQEYTHASSSISCLEESDYERSEGVKHIARTGLSGGARLLLEQGFIPMVDRVKAAQTALSNRRYSIALEILTTLPKHVTDFMC